MAIKRAKVVFGTNTKVTSRIICWVTGCAWSHVWIEYQRELEDKILYGIHSAKGGVQIQKVEDIHACYPTMKAFVCNLDLNDGYLWGIKNRGVPYDYGVIWTLILLLLYRVFKAEFLKLAVIRDLSKFTCSEFVCTFLQKAGVPGVVVYDPELTSPGDLYRFCRGSHNFEEIRTD
ncbi:MAG: hypothetical protein ACXADB_13615 [Candidatus Hermodarchaeia archaeon]|jgi:hypothetical protein